MLAKIATAIARFGYFPTLLLASFVASGIGDVCTLTLDAPFRMGLAIMLCTTFVLSVDHRESAPHATLAIIMGTSFESVLFATRVPPTFETKILTTTFVFAMLALAITYAFAPFIRRLQEEHPVGKKPEPKLQSYRSDLY